MEERINVAELLKDCPKGMELDCTLYENVEFDYIEQSPELAYPIHCITKTNGGYNALVFTHNGCNDRHPNAKCVIFPKGKTTWKGFVPPCEFKIGDVLFIDCADKESDGDVYKYIFILKEIDSLNNYFSYCHLSIDGFFSSSHYLANNRYTPRFATEEEKEKLFQAINKNGYRWNFQAKRLEKLIIPKFKKGDKVRVKKGVSEHRIIDDVCDTFYTLVPIGRIDFTDQDNWELVPNKFDITTLKPFESRVLIRDRNNDEWRGLFFSHYNNCSDRPYICIGNEGLSEYKQCIPYKYNEHLLGTTDDCDDYYKTWE